MSRVVPFLVAVTTMVSLLSLGNNGPTCVDYATTYGVYEERQGTIRQSILRIVSLDSIEEQRTHMRRLRGTTRSRRGTTGSDAALVTGRAGVSQYQGTITPHAEITRNDAVSARPYEEQLASMSSHSSHLVGSGNNGPTYVDYATTYGDYEERREAIAHYVLTVLHSPYTRSDEERFALVRLRLHVVGSDEEHDTLVTRGCKKGTTLSTHMRIVLHHMRRLRGTTPPHAETATPYEVRYAFAGRNGPTCGDYATLRGATGSRSVSIRPHREASTHMRRLRHLMRSDSLSYIVVNTVRGTIGASTLESTTSQGATDPHAETAAPYATLREVVRSRHDLPGNDAPTCGDCRERQEVIRLVTSLSDPYEERSEPGLSDSRESGNDATTCGDCSTLRGATGSRSVSVRPSRERRHRIGASTLESTRVGEQRTHIRRLRGTMSPMTSLNTPYGEQ